MPIGAADGTRIPFPCNKSPDSGLWPAPGRKPANELNLVFPMVALPPGGYFGAEDAKIIRGPTAIGAHAGSTKSGQEAGQICGACFFGHGGIDAAEPRPFEQRDEFIGPAPITALPVTVRKVDFRAQSAANQKFQRPIGMQMISEIDLVTAYASRPGNTCKASANGG